MKKVESLISDDHKQIPKKSVAKNDKSKMKNKKKRERNVYAIPGQKRDPPPERDCLRIFYETLYQQAPDSEMAAIWMMESGLLPEDVAKKVYEGKQKKSQLQKLGSPITAVSTTTTTTTTKKGSQSKSVTVKKVKDSSSDSSNKKNTTTTPSVKTKKRKKGDNDENSEVKKQKPESSTMTSGDKEAKRVKKQKTRL